MFYPGGPLIDKLAREGDKTNLSLLQNVGGYDYSFSGIKTSFLYFIRDRVKEDPDFVSKNIMIFMLVSATTGVGTFKEREEVVLAKQT